MLILLLLILLIFLIIGLYQLFRLTKWVFKKKTRIKWATGLVGVMVLVTLINHLFFKKMEFIQSKVYPNLYLIKYPVKDKDSLHSFIKKMLLEKVKNINDLSEGSIIELQYGLDFYEYYTGTPFFVPFGEAGTTHFIDNEEDPGGFSSELLRHYDAYRIAEFNLKFCKNDSLNYVGIINYYQEWDIIKTDTIINQCTIIKEEEPSEFAESVSDRIQLKQKNEKQD